jgi:hypothetical protein
MKKYENFIFNELQWQGLGPYPVSAKITETLYNRNTRSFNINLRVLQLRRAKKIPVLVPLRGFLQVMRLMTHF